MRLIIPSSWTRRRSKVSVAFIAAGMFVGACSSAPEITPAEQPLSKETVTLIGKKGMAPEKQIFVRIFKEESELEIWKARDDGRFYHLKTYPICNWSGDLGPKLTQGDKQAPEGFYTIGPTQMKPDSSYHVAFNLGFPNAYDRANRRTGQFLMVHGKCKSAGCYAMTDALVEEIYGLARESFKGGNPTFEVHAFPFRMTDEKLARFEKNKWYGFWRTLKQGYDYFEINRVPPSIAVCERRYMVDAVTPASMRINPEGRCPTFQKHRIEPFSPLPYEQELASERITMPGPKTRDIASIVPSQADPDAVALDPAVETAATSPPFSASTFPTGASALGFNSGQ